MRPELEQLLEGVEAALEEEAQVDKAGAYPGRLGRLSGGQARSVLLR